MLATFMEVLDNQLGQRGASAHSGVCRLRPDEATLVLTSYLVAKRDHSSRWVRGFRCVSTQAFYMICVGLFTV